MSADACYVTRPLLAVLLELARDADPDHVSIRLATRPASALDPDASDGLALADLPETTPVFADFYFPGAGGAVDRVFGMDLGTPAGQTQGRFVSHPRGDPSLATTDDLAPRVLVAVPPWDVEAVRAYDRSGTRRPLHVVAATAPEADFEHEGS